MSRSHHEQSQQAKDWFAAAFHAAWWLKLKPEARVAFDVLHDAHDLLDDKVAYSCYRSRLNR